MSEIKFTQDYAVYKPKEKKIYPVYQSDWERIKRMICAIVPNRKMYQILASVFLGMGASAILSLVGFYSVSNLPAWILPTMWGIFAVSLVLGVSLHILDGQQRQIISSSVNFVLREMQTLEDLGENPENELQIIKATYGKGDKTVDITDELNKVVEGNKLRIVLSNNIAGDPCNGIVKDGKVEYKYSNKILSAEFIEGQLIELPKPSNV